MNEERQEYLSDAELDALIRQVEKQEMLRAPSYLKNEILLSTRRETAAVDQRQEAFRKNRYRNGRQENLSLEKRKREFLFYSLRVSLAAAAAVVMLFALPISEAGGNRGGFIAAQEESARPSSRMVQSLSEHSTQFCRKLNSVSTRLVSENPGWE
ncbi:MAG: hypothetical protein Q4E91_04875 [Lachnospiraceae bacterium]|nr:hypothetical protein [Lachnospiraceae bacterium]